MNLEPSSDLDRKVYFEDLDLSDIELLVVILKKNQTVGHTTAYSSNGRIWKRIIPLYSSGGHITLARNLSKILGCRWLDATAMIPYQGDWDGQELPDHLSNLEVMAKATLGLFREPDFSLLEGFNWGKYE
jgi:hypothetical protein